MWCILHVIVKDCNISMHYIFVWLRQSPHLPNSFQRQTRLTYSGRLSVISRLIYFVEYTTSQHIAYLYCNRMLLEKHYPTMFQVDVASYDVTDVPPSSFISSPIVRVANGNEAEITDVIISSLMYRNSSAKTLKRLAGPI